MTGRMKGRTTKTVPLAAANAAFVRQAIALLETIDDGAFTRTSPPVYNSGVGPHLRHCIDHYDRFLDGHRTGRVDYDARARDRRLETDRLAARQALLDIAAALDAVAPDALDAPVDVVMDWGWADDTARSGVGDPRASGCPSTVRRELLFLVSHTVHHYALIAQILRHQGVDVPAGFGIAPSTLRHRGEQPETMPPAAERSPAPA